MISRTLSVRVSRHLYAGGLSQPPHAHDTTSCSIVLAGRLYERVGRREEAAQAFSVVLKPADTVHTDRYGPEGASLVRLTLDPASSAAIREWLPRLRLWRWLHFGSAVRPFMLLIGSLESCEGEPGFVPQDTLAWELLAAVADDADRRMGVPPVWLKRVREAVEDSPGAARLSEFARGAGVHPVYLARQFRRFFGCSLSTCVHRARVRMAADMIRATPMPLSRIALAAGFADQPHMCRIFRRETGLTPTAYQRLHREVPLVQDTGTRATLVSEHPCRRTAA